MTDRLGRIEEYLRVRRYSDHGNMIHKVAGEEGEADLYCSDLAVLVDQIHQLREQIRNAPYRFGT